MAASTEKRLNMNDLYRLKRSVEQKALELKERLQKLGHTTEGGIGPHCHNQFCQGINQQYGACSFFIDFCGFLEQTIINHQAVPEREISRLVHYLYSTAKLPDVDWAKNDYYIVNFDFLRNVALKLLYISENINKYHIPSIIVPFGYQDPINGKPIYSHELVYSIPEHAGSTKRDIFRKSSLNQAATRRANGRITNPLTPYVPTDDEIEVGRALIKRGGHRHSTRRRRSTRRRV